MKFYTIYEQIFPYGFGLTALLCIAVALKGFFTKKPVVIPFTISFLCYLGVLIPLFLLSINHFLVAWPLDWGAALLNGFGSIAPLLLIAYLWAARFEFSSVGAPAHMVKEILDRSEHGERKTPFLCLLLPSVCHLGMPSNESRSISQFRLDIQNELSSKVPQASQSGFYFCLLIGLICLATASISYCTSTLCLTGFGKTLW